MGTVGIGDRRGSRTVGAWGQVVVWSSSPRSTNSPRLGKLWTKFLYLEEHLKYFLAENLLLEGERSCLDSGTAAAWAGNLPDGSVLPVPVRGTLTGQRMV